MSRSPLSYLFYLVGRPFFWFWGNAPRVNRIFKSHLPENIHTLIRGSPTEIQYNRFQASQVMLTRQQRQQFAQRLAFQLPSLLDARECHPTACLCLLFRRPFTQTGAPPIHSISELLQPLNHQLLRMLHLQRH